MPSILIDRNYIIVEGIKIPRPSRMSPDQWLSYWEACCLPRP